MCHKIEVIHINMTLGDGFLEICKRPTSKDVFSYYSITDEEIIESAIYSGLSPEEILEFIDS